MKQTAFWKKKKRRVCSMFKIFCTYICWIIYKMQHLEVSGAVRHIYVFRQLRVKEHGEAFGFGIHYTLSSFPLYQLQSRQWHLITTTAKYERGHGTVYVTQLIVYCRYDLSVWRQSPELADVNTLRTGLSNCLNARSRGLTFRHRASCIWGQAFHYLIFAWRCIIDINNINNQLDATITAY